MMAPPTVPARRAGGIGSGLRLPASSPPPRPLPPKPKPEKGPPAAAATLERWIGSRSSAA